MNQVNIIGRLTKDPQESATTSGMTVARFSVAIDRGKDKDGKDKGADYISCAAFGKTAEFICKWLKKGRNVGITGHLQSGNYEKDGQTHYTTTVIVDKVTMIDWGDKTEKAEDKPEDPHDGYSMIGDDDVPF